MTKCQLLFATISLALFPSLAPAQRVGIGIGFNVGPPAYYYGPRYYHPYPRYYYAPAPVVYTAPPVYVQPSPVYVQPAPATVALPAASAPAAAVPAATSQPLPPPTPVVQANHQGDGGRCDQLLQQIRDPQETTRRDAVMDLGRMKAQTALEPLTEVLRGDPSPVVRESAARALGLICSPRALSALIYAVQADQDRDVRSSAQFAIEIIRTNAR